jgi:hypothetical protein
MGTGVAGGFVALPPDGALLLPADGDGGEQEEKDDNRSGLAAATVP